MKRLLPGLFIVLLALLANGAPADSATFDQANKFYEEGRYQEAIKDYQRLLTDHPSVTVHFNLGNAYFKSGQIGEAIAEYREAELLAPRDPDVLANLKFARQQVVGPSYKTGRLQQTFQALMPREWATLASCTVWLFFTILIARQLLPKWRSRWRAGTLVTGTLAAILLSCAIWASRSRVETRLAVVTQAKATARLGPFEEAQSALTLKDGAELRVLDEKDGWLQVTADGKQVGWIQTAMVRKVRP